MLEDCRLPAQNVLGEVGKGYKIAIETLNEGRIGIGAQMLGLAAGAWHCAKEYARERKQFGKAIGEFQAVQFTIAEMATEIEAARLLVYNAARLKDANQPFSQGSRNGKVFSSHVAERVASLSVEIFGGYGFVKDYPVESSTATPKSARSTKALPTCNWRPLPSWSCPIVGSAAGSV